MKKIMDMFFFFFPVAEKRKKKKENGAEIGLGYCPTVSQYNGKLYCDIAGFGSAVGSKCIAAWGSLGEVYCNRRDCIVTERESWLGWNLCRNTH